MHFISLLATLAATSDTSVPSVYLEETFEVKEQLGLQYGAGVLCNAQECEMDPKSDCQRTQPPSGGDPSLAKYAIPGCEKPARFNLTLDLYTPIGAASLGPRPAFIAIHSGGYAVNNERGFAPTYEMTAACKYFAARGFIALTMDYRLFNKQTGGGLAPANWTNKESPLPQHGWKGGFDPGPQAIYPAVRDSKAAIRWLRGVSEAGGALLQGSVLATDYVGAGGWSAGACTTAFLASQQEGDFTDEMNAATDPTYNTLIPYLNQSSAIKAGVVWAGNGAVTDTIDIFSNVSRFATPSMPLAMYRGSKDSTMTPWAQQEVQRKFNASGSRCDLFAVPGVGHSSLFPNGNVTTKNGVPVAKPAPVLDHSYGWITEAMGLIVKP